MSAIAIRTAQSEASGAAAAVKEIAEAITQPDMSVVLFFVSSRYDLDVLAAELAAAFPCPVIGCTSSGEFVTGMGYTNGCIVAASISSPKLSVHVKLLSPISTFSVTDAGIVASGLLTSVKGGELSPQSMFGLLFVDGLSFMEERVISALQGAFGGVSIVGGSAGDDLHFTQTSVYYEGAFHSDAALLTLFETTLPFTIFQTQHFIRSDRKFQITDADPDTRTVYTINDRRAAAVYAEALGVEESELSNEHFSMHPLILRLGGQNYVRSLREVLPDGSLVFYSAIDKGLMLYLGTGHDIVYNLQNALQDSLVKVPYPKLLIGFECVLRRLEAEAQEVAGKIQGVLNRMEYIGFHTYGEQVDSLHVNQTFTGVIIGDHS